MAFKSSAFSNHIARFYDPVLGRFLQVDPKREFWNSYSYVGNNPVGGVDPTGMAFKGTPEGELIYSLIGPEINMLLSKTDGTEYAYVVRQLDANGITPYIDWTALGRDKMQQAGVHLFGVEMGEVKAGIVVMAHAVDCVAEPISQATGGLAPGFALFAPPAGVFLAGISTVSGAISGTAKLVGADFSNKDYSAGTNQLITVSLAYLAGNLAKVPFKGVRAKAGGNYFAKGTHFFKFGYKAGQYIPKSMPSIVNKIGATISTSTELGVNVGAEKMTLLRAVLGMKQ